MRFACVTALAVLVGLVAFAGSRAVEAAEIQLLGVNALRAAMEKILPEFEASSGHQVKASYASAGTNADRVQKGDIADVVTVSRPQIAPLLASGKLLAGTDIDIAKVGMGVFVRKGAAKPEIGSVDAFKRTLLSAKSLLLNDPVQLSPVGLYMP